MEYEYGPSKEEIEKMYKEIAEEEKEIEEHNQQIIKSHGKNAEKDFEHLMDDCELVGKIEIVASPLGTAQQENCGIYKRVHVDQRSVGLEGDSFEGHIYAFVKKQWIKVPFSC